MLKVVFDTQIYLRALINPASICGRLAFEWDSYYTLCLTDKIEAEVLDVLNRPRLRQKFTQITDERVALIASRLRKAQWVTISDQDVEPICRDPKDDIFLACAKVSGADYLISEDRDLLVLKEHAAAKIVDAITFLDILRGVQEAPHT
jgi:uncharacterized protein